MPFEIFFSGKVAGFVRDFVNVYQFVCVCVLLFLSVLRLGCGIWLY